MLFISSINSFRRLPLALFFAASVILAACVPDEEATEELQAKALATAKGYINVMLPLCLSFLNSGTPPAETEMRRASFEPYKPAGNSFVSVGDQRIDYITEEGFTEDHLGMAFRGSCTMKAVANVGSFGNGGVQPLTLALAVDQVLTNRGYTSTPNERGIPLLWEKNGVKYSASGLSEYGASYLFLGKR